VSFAELGVRLLRVNIQLTRNTKQDSAGLGWCDLGDCFFESRFSMPSRTKRLHPFAHAMRVQRRK
jgi:hypothetical protein